MTRTVSAKDVYGTTHELYVDNLRWRPSAYAVIIKDNSVLLLPAFGGYALPGGGLELGESIEAGLLREVREETGITVRVSELLGVESNFFVLPGTSKKGNDIQSILLYYKCAYVSGDLTTEFFDENEQEYGGLAEWVALSNLDDIKVVSSEDWRKFIRMTK